MSLPSIPSSTPVTAALGPLGVLGDRGEAAGMRATAATLGTLAGRVAGTIAQALALDPDARGQGGARRDGGSDPDDDGASGDDGGSGGGGGVGATGDPYAVAQAADALARGVAASPGEAGAIARALHGFVTEVAAMVGAAPDARAIELVGRVVADASGRNDAAGPPRRVDADEVLSIIERATRALATGLPAARSAQPAR